MWRLNQLPQKVQFLRLPQEFGLPQCGQQGMQIQVGMFFVRSEGFCRLSLTVPDDQIDEAVKRIREMMR